MGILHYIPARKGLNLTVPSLCVPPQDFEESQFCCEEETEEKTVTFSLINPSSSSIDMVFGGGQNVKCTATNNNILGVALKWENVVVSPKIKYNGILLPFGSTTFDDGLFGYVPVTYRFKASTISSAANIGFSYKTRL